MESTTDLTYLKEVTNNDAASMQIFIRSFLEAGPFYTEQLQQNSSLQNWPGVMKAAHLLKPHAVYMGMAELVDLLQNIEDCAAEKTQLDQMLEKTQHVKALATKAIAELTQIANLR